MIGAIGVVVVQGHPTDPGPSSDVDHVLDGAVTPPDVVAVLRCAVLRIVDQQVGPRDEPGMGFVVPVLFDVPTCGEGLVVRFVVRRIDHGGAIGLEAIAQGQRRVVQELGVDTHLGDVEGALDQVMMVDRRRELVDRHREVAVLHLAGEDLAEGVLQSARAVDVPGGARLEQWSEERQTLDVVPVGVADQDVPVDGCPIRPARAVPGRGREHPSRSR